MSSVMAWAIFLPYLVPADSEPYCLDFLLWPWTVPMELPDVQGLGSQRAHSYLAPKWGDGTGSGYDCLPCSLALGSRLHGSLHDKLIISLSNQRQKNSSKIYIAATYGRF